MAPAKKSKSVNNRISFANEVSPIKDGNNSKKSTKRKRKLSDMLGSQWSREELEHFYEAYRKYGKDWKKVGAAVRNRSMEMVEALFMMNKAYLSLPEGIASVAGLIAMMSDHYNNQVESDGEQESNDGGETSQKSQKRGCCSVRTKTSKGSEEKLLPHPDTAALTSDCLSLLKKPSGGTRPRAVGKRTPRVPVSFLYEKVGGRKYIFSTRQGWKLNADTEDESVEHEVALVLAGASQRGDSPPVSQISSRRTGNVMSSPILSGERMSTELGLMSAKHHSDVNKDLEGRSGSRVGDKVEFARGRSSLMGSEDAGTAVGKGRRIYVKKSDIYYGVSNHLDDIKEANDGTEEQNFGMKAGNIPHYLSKKKSKKALFSGDEGSAFGALQTLADLSLMMPATETGGESTLDVKEKEGNLRDKYEVVETDPVNHQLDRRKSSGVKTKKNQAGHGSSGGKTSELGKGSGCDNNGIHEVKEQLQKSTSRLSRRKQKIFTSKILREVHTVTRLSESQEAEATDAGRVTSKDNFSPFSTSKQKHENLIRYPDHSSPSGELRGKNDESVIATAHSLVPNQADLHAKVRSRHKKDLQKPQKLKDLNKIDMLSNCLSNERERRWCAFEWFYSAIDYPWFAKREFVEYLKHVGLGHVPRLTRVEWGVIRSSLGKPRRLSEQFLKEEKDKLSQYRDSVRKHYTELREGAREGLPTDLARPLSVGQRVMAIHPKTREIHDGSVLTVDHNQCGVRFDRPELGVEFVLDIDCMPLNPLENMPASLASKATTVDKSFSCFNDLQMSGQAKYQKLEGSKKISSGESLEHVDAPFHSSPTHHLSNLMKQAKGIPCDSNFQPKVGKDKRNNGQPVVNYGLLAQIQGKEADVQALAELSRVLDKKEAVLSELKHMNDYVSENQKNGGNALKDSESFKKLYAAVLVQLKAINDQVSCALRDLRQRNTYHISPPARSKATSIIGDSGGPLNSFDQQADCGQEFGSHIHEIVESPRRKARASVDSAMRGIPSDPNFQAKVGKDERDRGQQVVNYAPVAQMEAKEADVQALTELSRVLDKKEAVLSELKNMNDHVSESQRDGDNALKDSGFFKKQYAEVLVQFKAVNDQANHVQEFRSHILEIVESSRRKARALVDSAMQALSSLKIEESTLERIYETIDYISNRLTLDDSCVEATRPPPTPIHGSLTLSTGSELELENGSDSIEAQIPSKLISHCVATLLMIQKCTERQFPPEDVAEILDNAVVSLQPGSQQNISVYGEIQKCMGIIRNQILALIP